MALIGIDIGGTGAKVFSFSENGKILAHEYREHEPIRQKPGCFELDASKIWESIENMIYIVAQKSNESVTAITVSSLGECFVCLDKDDNILSKCITYHDSRGKDSFKKFQEDFKKETIEYILEGAHPSFVQTLFRLLIIKHTQPDVLKKPPGFVFYLISFYICLVAIIVAIIRLLQQRDVSIRNLVNGMSPSWIGQKFPPLFCLNQYLRELA